MSRQELDRLDGAVRFMKLYTSRKRSIWFVSTESGTPRVTINSIWKRVTKLQGEHDLPRYSVVIFEPGRTGGLGGHIVFLGNRKIAAALRRSEALQAKADEAVKHAHDPEGLVRGYLSKKRTPQAGYRREASLGGRIRGSHEIEGGGDRVRPSDDLRRDAIEARFIEPWQRTNARPAQRARYQPRRNQRLGKSAPCPAGQLSLLPELERPVARLRDFGGGKIPAAVATEIEFRRRQRGLSQRQLALMIGRSQGQYANAMRGHDPISAAAVNRLREVLLADNTGQKQATGLN